MYDNLTIVTAIDKNYCPKLAATIPTWFKWKGFDKIPEIIVYLHGMVKRSHNLDFLRQYKNVRLIKWNPTGVETQRERMLSAFVLGAAEHVKTPYWYKIDSEAVGFTDQPLEAFTCCDIVGQKWGYTKPHDSVMKIDHWLMGLEKLGKVKLSNPPEGYVCVSVTAGPYKGYGGEIIRTMKRGVRIKLDKRSRTETKEKKIEIEHTQFKPRKYNCKRFCSWICCHRSEFVRAVAEKIVHRLIVPSHDTLLWRYAERVEGCKWTTYNFKGAGWCQHTRNWKELAEQAMAGTLK